jgi:archaellum biogenesis ATPase FlaH
MNNLTPWAGVSKLPLSVISHDISGIIASDDFNPTTFAAFWKLGFHRLVPIIPPEAGISETSSLFKRVGTDQDPRGKAPGVKGAQGLWYGFDWVPHDSTEHDLPRWQAMEAGIGIKTGGGIVAIDADTLSNEHARIIRDTIERRMGRLPCRIGNFPKALYLIGLTEPMKYTRVEFGDLGRNGRLKDRVEILSDGRQFVAHGIHPGTRQPYNWTRDILPFDKLPKFAPADVLALLEELRSLLPAAKPLITEGATTEIAQASLRGPIDKVRKAVEATPNNSKLFGTREAYRDFGYAIKAALPDNEPEAFNLFSDWCERWVDEKGQPVDPGNNPDIVASDWRRMRPPFRRGASWLFELAEMHNPAAFKKIDVFFDEIVDEERLFVTEKPAAVSKEIAPLEWIDPTKWEGQPLRAREWVVEGWVPKGEVTFLYGDGGVGKSLLAQQLATCAATGNDWLGQPTTQSRVMCFFCEDSADELHRRQTEINRAVGVSFSDLSALRMISRKHMDNLFSLWDRHTGAMREQAVWRYLLADAKSFGANVLVVDTIADTYSGSEIDRGQVNVFVKSVLGRLAEEIGGSVIALGHPSQAGKSSGQGTSGSTAWSNAARSRLYLRHPKDAERGNIRELEGMKLNYGPKGSLLKLRWSRGAFEVLAGSRPAGATPNGLTPAFQSIGSAAEDAVASVLLSNDKERLNLTPRSPYFAPKVLKRLDPEGLAAFTHAEVEEAMNSLVRRKVIRAEQVGVDGSYRPTFGFVVVPDNLSSEEPPAAAIFD